MSAVPTAVVAVVIAITNLSFRLSAEHAITAGHVHCTTTAAVIKLFFMLTSWMPASGIDSMIRLLGFTAPADTSLRHKTFRKHPWVDC